MEENKKKFVGGSANVADAIADYAYKVLPEEISEKARIDEVTVKRMYAEDKIASEPREYQTQKKETLQNSLGPAFINSSWRYCGVESLAKSFLNRSKSWLEKAMQKGKCCRGDKWGGFTWFTPSSYGHLKKDCQGKKGDKPIIYDPTSGSNIK